MGFFDKLGSLFGGGTAKEGGGVNPQTGEEQEESSGVGAFMRGVPYAGFKSSNVKSGQYDQSQSYLKLGFKNGGYYGYHDVSPNEAKSFYDSGSKGKWVWDRLRRRGTVFGYQKPYALIGGLSQASGYTPKYYKNQQHYQEHKGILPGGVTPATWQSGGGPYHPGYGGGVSIAMPQSEQDAMSAKKVPIAQAAETQPEIPMAQRATPRRKPSGSGLFSKLFGSIFGGQRKQSGGEINQRFGTPGMDNEPMFAEPGEYVVPKHAAQQYRSLLDAISGKGNAKHFMMGGAVRNAARSYLGYQGGITGAIAGMMGRGEPGGQDGAKELISASEMLKDAAKHLSDAAQHLGAGPAPLGSSLSPWQWSKGKVSQLIHRGQAGQASAGQDAGGSEGVAMLGGAATVAALAFFKLKDVAGGLVDKFTSMVKAASDPRSLLGGLVAPYTSQVGALNPGAVERLNLALDNLSAAAGRIFEPVVDVAMRFADEMNVLYTSVGDEFRGAVEVVAEAFRGYGREVAVGFMGALRDGVREIGPALRELGPLMRTAGVTLREMWGALVPVGRGLLSLLNAISPIELSANSVRTAFEELAVQVIVTTGIMRDLADRASGIGPATTQSSGFLASMAYGAIMPHVSIMNLLGGLVGPGINDRFANARAMVQGSGSPLTGNMTAAAQPARQVGIEQVGLEARATAFSGQGIPQQQLSTLRDILAWLRQFAPQGQPQWLQQVQEWLNIPNPQINN